MRIILNCKLQTPNSNKLILLENQVHIWFINTDNFLNHVADFIPFLSPDEIAKSKKFYSPLQCDRAIINRYYLRHILGKHYLNISPEKIEFSYSEKGKPQLKPQKTKLHFNLSHKNQYTVYGFCQQNLGIDLEIYNEKIDVLGISKRFFHEKEYHDLKTIDNLQERIEYFIKLWTAKEAYLKATGKGLSGGLDSLNLSFDKHHQSWEILDNKSLISKNLWHIETLTLEQDKTISVAVNFATNQAKNIKYEQQILVYQL